MSEGLAQFPSQKYLCGEARGGGNLRPTVLLEPTCGDADWRVFSPLNGFCQVEIEEKKRRHYELKVLSCSKLSLQDCVGGESCTDPLQNSALCPLRGQPCTAGQASRCKGRKLALFSPPHLSPLPSATSPDFEI